jgi:hypothetical protein
VCDNAAEAPEAGLGERFDAAMFYTFPGIAMPLIENPHVAIR